MDPMALINVALLALLVIAAIAIVRLRNLFAVAMLGGLYSLITAGVFVALDAVDVAFTEAAVGAGVTTVFLLGALVLTDREERVPSSVPFLPLLLVFAVGAILVYVTLAPEFPRFGDPNAPIQQHVAPAYLEDRVPQAGRDEPTHVGIPNVVTTTLASYRGYDTLGEVVVIFTAGVGVMLLLGVGRPPKGDKTEEGGDGQ